MLILVLCIHPYRVVVFLIRQLCRDHRSQSYFLILWDMGNFIPRQESFSFLCTSAFISADFVRFTLMNGALLAFAPERSYNDLNGLSVSRFT